MKQGSILFDQTHAAATTFSALALAPRAGLGGVIGQSRSHEKDAGGGTKRRKRQVIRGDNTSSSFSVNHLCLG